MRSSSSAPMTGAPQTESAQTLLALAERCEEADAPSRELSDAVLVACGWVREVADHDLGDGRTSTLTSWTTPQGESWDAKLDASLYGLTTTAPRTSPTASMRR